MDVLRATFPRFSGNILLPAITGLVSPPGSQMLTSETRLSIAAISWAKSSCTWVSKFGPNWATLGTISPPFWSSLWPRGASCGAYSGTLCRTGGLARPFSGIPGDLQKPSQFLVRFLCSFGRRPAEQFDHGCSIWTGACPISAIFAHFRRQCAFRQLGSNLGLSANAWQTSNTFPKLVSIAGQMAWTRARRATDTDTDRERERE